MGPGFGILFAILAVLVVLFVGAALLRGAVAVANKTLGRVKTDSPIGWDWDADEDEDVDFDDGAPAMPEPGLGQGMAILFLTAVVDLAIALVIGFVAELDRPFRRTDEWIAVRLLAVVGGFILLTAFLAGLLPTTAKRAWLAALYFYLILLTIGALIAGMLFVVFRF